MVWLLVPLKLTSLPLGAKTPPEALFQLPPIQRSPKLVFESAKVLAEGKGLLKFRSPLICLKAAPLKNKDDPDAIVTF